MPPYDRDTLAALCDVPEPPPWQPPPWPKDCPEPGIYRGKPYEEYAGWSAVNASALKAGVALSPLHMRQVVEGPSKDSGDRKFGRAVHVRFLEPETFAERVRVATPCCAPLKSGTRKGEPCGLSAGAVDDTDHWYCGKHLPTDRKTWTPDDYVDQAELARINKMWAAVVKHPAVALLRAHGGCEVSIVWDRDGIPCKARLDKLIEGGPDGQAWIVDLKKCGAFHIDDRSINRAITDYRYDVQAYWYLDGYQRLTGKRTAFAWIFMEDGPPYDVRPKRATRGWLVGGRQLAEWAFGLYRQSLQTGNWPGVSADWDEDPPPEWYLKRHGVTL